MIVFCVLLIALAVVLSIVCLAFARALFRMAVDPSRAERERCLRVIHAAADAARSSGLGMLEGFVKDAKGTPDTKIESKKGDILNVTKALRYLTKFHILPEDIAAKKDLEGIVKAREWEKKK